MCYTGAAADARLSDSCRAERDDGRVDRVQSKMSRQITRTTAHR